MIKKFLICFSFCFLFVSSSFANSDFSQLLSGTRTIRGTALGDAIVACPQGVDAIFYNPSGIYAQKFSYSNESLDTHKTEFVLNHQTAFNIGKFGYGWERKHNQNIWAQIQSFSLGVATKKKLWWGITYKQINYQLDNTATNKGYSFDFGILNPLSRNLSLGLMIRDIFKDEVPLHTSIITGLALKFNQEQGLIALDCEYFRYRKALNLRCGFEYQLDESLVLRTGYAKEFWRAGAVLVFPFAKLEYALMTSMEETDTETKHQIGVYLGK